MSDRKKIELEYRYALTRRTAAQSELRVSEGEVRTKRLALFALVRKYCIAPRIPIATNITLLTDADLEKVFVNCTTVRQCLWVLRHRSAEKIAATLAA